MNIRKRIGTRLGITTIVILMVAVTALGVAVAATIPDSAGVIHGCYGRGTGNVRIVESASKCRNFETPITWQQTGEAGEQGPTGPQGPQGLEGPAGPAGTGTLGPSGSARETNPGGQHFYFTCSNPGFTGFVSVVELPVTLTSASTIHAFGHILPETGTLNPVDIWSIARAELLSGPDIVASRDGGRVVLRGTPHRTNSESMVSGPLLSASNVNEVDIAAPGSYTLRLVLTDTRVSLNAEYVWDRAESPSLRFKRFRHCKNAGPPAAPRTIIDGTVSPLQVIKQYGGINVYQARQ